MLRLSNVGRVRAIALLAMLLLPGAVHGASYELAATNTSLNALSTGGWLVPGAGDTPGQFRSVITPNRFIYQRFAAEGGGVSLDPKQRRFRDIVGSFTYQQAVEDARARGGHLAVITSAAEQQEMMDAIGPGDGQRWLGGSDQNVEGQWEWVTGESFVYQNWNSGEPNNAGNEDFLELIRSGPAAGRWNDVPGGLVRGGYILEIESNNTVVRGVSGGTSLFVESMVVGLPYVGKASEFLIGSIIPPPATDEEERLLAELPVPLLPRDYWESIPLNNADALSPTNENYGRFYYSASKGEVFATASGSTTLKWIKRIPDVPPIDERSDATKWLDRGGVYHRIYERTYVVSASPVKRPRRIYHTEGAGANGLAVYIPSSRIAGLKVVYNNNFPEEMPVGKGTPVFNDGAVGSSNPGADQATAEIRGTLFYSSAQNVLRAANKEGRVFVELIGPLDPSTGIGEHLGFEIVDVIADAIPNNSRTSLGDPLLRPTVQGGTGEILYPKVGNPPEGNSYVYLHNPTGSELETTFYAVRETRNINDLSVWWMIEGEQGILWPEQLHRYDLKWPDDPARFSHYLRPAAGTDAEAQTTAVLMPRSNSARIEYQDGEEAPRAKFTADFRFYTFLSSQVPAHRTLLSFKSGNDIAFERVFSWLQGNLESDQWTGTAAAQLSSWRDSTELSNGIPVKTMVWENPARMPRLITQNVNVGQRIEPPELDPEETRDYVAGWLQVDERRYDLYDPLSYINPFVAGFDEAAAGAIIPVNAIEGRDQLKVFWFRRNQFPPNRGFETIYWPSVIGTYVIRWPHEDPQWSSSRETTVVLASNDGSGPLPGLEAQGAIYYQNDASFPGYNPNEEHAVMVAGQAYALRDDLNIVTPAGYSSDPYILLSYRDENSRPRMRTFRVLREDAENTFEYPLVAGTVIQPPMPLPLLPKPVPGDSLRDRFLDLDQDALAINLNRIIEPVSVQTSSYDPTAGRWTLIAADGMLFGDFTPLYLEPASAADPTLHFLGDAVDWPLEIRGYVSEFPIVRLPVPDPEYTVADSIRYTLSTAEAAMLAALAAGDPVVLADRAGRRTYGLTVTSVDLAQRKLVLSYASTVFGGGLVGRPLFDSVPLMLVSPTKVAARRAANALANHTLSADRFPPELPGADSRFARYRVPVLKDRKGNQWAYRGPHVNGDGTAGIQAHWFYRTQEGFFFPSLAIQPAVGSLAPYLRPLEANGLYSGPVYIDQSSTDVASFPVSYRIRWPDSTPELRPGQTLANPIFGLPAVRGNTSAEVLYEQSIASTTNQARSVTLHDPTREKEYAFGQPGGLTRIPDSIRTSSSRGRTYFPNLPPHLVERLFFDPNRGASGALVFKGEFRDEPVGEDYFLLNTAAGDDWNAMAVGLIDPADPNQARWVAAINGLTARVETFEEDRAKRGTYKVARTVNRVVGELVEVDDDDTAVDSYALSANGPGRGYVSLLFGNGLAFTPFEEPVSIQIIRVDGPLHRGEVKPIAAANPLAEKLTMLHTADLAASTHLYEYDWRIAAPVDGVPPPVYAKDPAVLATANWEELATVQAGEAGNSLPDDSHPRWRPLGLGSPLTVVERKSATASTYDAATQRWRLTLSGASRFSPGDFVRLQGFIPADLDGSYAVVASDATTVTVGLSSLSGPVQTYGSVTEETSTTGAQSIIRGWFTLPSGEEWDDVHVSVAPDARLAFRLWINGSLAVVRGWPGVPDTATMPAPYGFTPLPQIYRLDSALVRPGTHALVLELRSDADPGAALSFSLKVEANRWVDHPNLGGTQWLSREAIAADLRRVILGESADVQALSDNYLIVRYRAINPSHSTRFDESGAPVAGWSKWTDPALAEGWIKRVLAGINPFNQRVNDLFANRVDTSASVLTQAGPRWEGDVALSLENINDSGLIEIYETVMNRGRMLSIDAGINYGPANDALLLAAGYLNDLYVMIGNEAWADAANPTIGIGSKDGNYGSIATALFAFKGQLPSLMEEELALLRGRDDFLQPGTRTPPVYNRLFWNYTRGIDSGEVIYALNYNILEDNDQGVDGVINADDARKMFPQGHGDAYGHYLTALKGYYRLLMSKDFTWVPRTEAVNILGKPVQVDYADERKFAAAGAAVARTGKQVVDLTWRKDYVPRSSEGDDLSWDTMFAATRGNPATGQTRYWGVDHWASRVAQGDLIHWVVGNAMLPEVDPDPTHEGIQKIDRTTVPELQEFPALMEALQVSMDNAEAGLNPLGLPENTVPMDITPTVTSIEYFEDGYTHFEQVYSRALVALRNAAASFDDAKDVTQLMRSEQDSVAEFQTEVSNQELAYKHTLIEVYGTPYPDDVGPGKTYATGYDGPDFFHYMYVDTVRQDFENATHPNPNSTYTQRVDVQQYPASWFFDAKTSFDWVKRGIYPSGVIDARSATNYVEYHLDGHGFLQKPQAWKSRRGSPGEIQRAISDIIMAHNEAYEALKQHDAQKYQLDRMIDVFENKVNAHEKVRGLRKDLLIAKETLRWVKFAADNGVEWGELLYSFTDKAQEAAKEAVPKVTIAGLAVGGDFLSAVRATITLGQAATKGSWDVAKQIIKSTLAAFDNSVNTANDWVEFNEIGPTDWTQELRESVYEIDMQLGNVQMTLYTIYGKLQALSAAYESYRSAVAKGDRIQAEREIFRQRAAAVIQGYRTRDAAFRIFRNEKLERYKTLQDTASRYAYLAAKAYDYETGLLDTEDGRRFLNRIVSARALGVVRDGEPQYAGSNTGDPGISSVLAEMKADFDVLRGRLGLNNPKLMGTTASLRMGNWRILPTEEGDTAWHDVLQAGRRADLRDDPDVRRYCLGIESADNGPIPGIVLEFSTVIEPGYNLFGQRLAAGDHALESSYFATKLLAVGAAFEGYIGMDTTDASANLVGLGGGQSPVGSLTEFLNPRGLSANPTVFLVPVGLDTMRSPPLGDTSRVRTWKVEDVAIPLPFNVGASGFSSLPLWTSAQSLSEPLFAIRKHPAFRPLASGDEFSTTHDAVWEYATTTRLIGRSAWNSRWKLVIPGNRLLNDPNEGLNRFLATVKDIKIHFKTYSYAGN